MTNSVFLTNKNASSCQLYYTKMQHFMLIVRLQRIYALVRQFQPRPALPPPPPSFYETFSRLTAPGVGICQPRDPQRDFWHSRSFQCKYITTQRILLGKQADWIICQGARGQRIKEDCKAMFSFLCMYSFIAYQARIT